MRLLVRWIGRIVLLACLVVAAVVLAWAFLSRNLPELKPWHRDAPRREARASDLDGAVTLVDYLRREDDVMREVRERIEGRRAGEARQVLNRYDPGSPLNPRRFETDWNRTFELAPSRPAGGVLLVHGMTDSPYSMRRIARIFRESGYYALALRMPGHGTVPAGLAQARWEDWAAAVRLGVRHVRQRAGRDRPLVLVGYSNGGALVLDYALDALEDPALARPDRLVLLSPMVGVTAAAGLSPLLSLLSGVPYFERSAWTGIQVEYNPFKYNSFPAAAAHESARATRTLDRKLAQAAESGRIGGLPPVLTFQSAVDATVVTGAVVDRLYSRLRSNGSALVIFDLNRVSRAAPLLHPAMHGLVARLFQGRERRYRLSVVANASPDTLDVVEKDVAPEATAIVDRPLGLAWPRGVFSLSHVALPFATDDPLYGIEPDAREDYGLRLGQLEPRGERGVLAVSVEDLMRLSCNPFFPYLESRVREWIRQEPPGGVSP